MLTSVNAPDNTEADENWATSARQPADPVHIGAHWCDRAAELLLRGTIYSSHA